MKFKQIMFAICSLAIAGAALADTQGPQWQLLAPDQMPAQAPAVQQQPMQQPAAQKITTRQAQAPMAQPTPMNTPNQAKAPMTKLMPIGATNDRHYPGANLVHQRPISVLVNTGSLRQIVTRIAHNHGWYIVEWNSPNDYLWVGKTRITAATLPGVFDKLLSDYPVQAQFYQGNHVLAIEPRTLK